MIEKMSDKVTIYRCRRCHRKIWVLESIVRGMGPICYGKSYSMRRMLKRGLTREEILNIPKDELEQLARQELRRWKRKQKRSQKKNNNIKIGRINKRKIKGKKIVNQKTLDSFLMSSQHLNPMTKESMEDMRKKMKRLDNFSKIYWKVKENEMIK